MLAMPAAAEQSAEALYTVMAGHECRVAPPEVAEIFGPEGFTPDFVKETLTTLIVDGTASLDAGGSLSLPASLCPPDRPAPSPRRALLAALAETDCVLEDGDLDRLRPQLGLDDAQLRAILMPLYESGAAKVTRSSARIDPALCATEETE